MYQRKKNPVYSLNKKKRKIGNICNTKMREEKNVFNNEPILYMVTMFIIQKNISLVVSGKRKKMRKKIYAEIKREKKG